MVKMTWKKKNYQLQCSDAARARQNLEHQADAILKGRSKKQRRKDQKTINIGLGAQCPKCGKPMKRCSHPDTWKPKPGQPFYFAYWDKCYPCHHIQHYEAAKRMLQPKKEAWSTDWSAPDIDALTAEYNEIMKNG